MSWPAYPQYVSSGVRWLNDIPSGWGVVPLKRVATVFPSNVDKHTQDGETPVQLCNYTDVYNNDAINDDLDFMEATATKDEIRKFTLRRGDTIITKDSESADDIGLSAYVEQSLAGVLCGYHLSVIRPSNRLNGRFVKRLFDSHYLKAVMAVSANGLTRVGLGQYAIDNLDIPLPPLSEQEQIVHFLEVETARIDALITKQEQLIDTLREDRTATITYAVTKGLDPKVEIRESGVEWLGEVPSHWSTRRLATTYQERDERLGIRDEPELLSVSIHRGVRPRRELITDKEARADDFTKYKLCSAGDIVLNRMRAFQGGLGVADQDGMVSPDYMVMRVYPVQSADFLGYLMKTPWFVEQMTLRLRGIGGVDQGNARTPRINPRDLGSIQVAMPPTAEQHEIVDSLREVLSDVDALIAKTGRLIEVMREYRSALITDAVTGQIDVRGAA